MARQEMRAQTDVDTPTQTANKATTGRPGLATAGQTLAALSRGRFCTRQCVGVSI